MKNYIIIIFTSILFIGCSSSQQSFNNSNNDKFKILFIINYTFEQNSIEQTLVNNFINDFKYHLVESPFKPIDYLLIKSESSSRYDYNSVYFKNGHLTFNGYVYGDDMLLKYKQDDAVFITFNFKNADIGETSLSSVDLYIFNSTTRSMNNISIENSLFSNLANKVIDNLSDSSKYLTPRYNTEDILSKRLSEIIIDLNQLDPSNEFDRLETFEDKIEKTKIISSRLYNLSTFAQDSELLNKIKYIKNKLVNKIIDIYLNSSENQIEKCKELLNKYENNLTKQQLDIINNRLNKLYDSSPFISIEIKGWQKLNNSNLQQFSNLLSKRVQNIWHQKDTIKFVFQYQNTIPSTLIIEYHSKKFPFSFLNIDNNNYTIFETNATVTNLLLCLLANFSLYNNYVPELSYDLDKFLANLTIYYIDSQYQNVCLLCLAYKNSYDVMDIKVSEVGYKQKSWPTYKLIKSMSNYKSGISFTTYQKDFMQFLSNK